MTPFLGAERAEQTVARAWSVDPGVTFKRRLGKAAAELGNTSQGKTCPDIWKLRNGDIAIVSTDMTEAFSDRIPSDMTIGAHERPVVIPRNMLVAARPEIPDA